MFICLTPTKSPYYYGVDKANPQRFIALPASPAGTGYTARNGTTVYSINDARLHVTTGTHTDLDQSVVDHLP